MEQLYGALARAILIGLGAIVVFMTLTVFVSNYWPWMLAILIGAVIIKLVFAYHRNW